MKTLLPLLCLAIASCAAPLKRETTQVSCCGDYQNGKCSPTGTCTACTTCSSCGHCKAGGKCSVCK